MHGSQAPTTLREEEWTPQDLQVPVRDATGVVLVGGSGDSGVPVRTGDRFSTWARACTTTSPPRTLGTEEEEGTGDGEAPLPRLNTPGTALDRGAPREERTEPRGRAEG